MVNKSPSIDTVLITCLPLDEWFEAFAHRPNHHLLAASLHGSFLYDLDVEDPNSGPRLLYEFPGIAGILALCPISGHPDEYTVITSDLTNPEACKWERFAVWHLNLRMEGSPRGTRNGDITDIILPLGLCPAIERYMLVADSAKACIHILDSMTGESSILLAHEQSMRPRGENQLFGVHRIRVAGGYIWYTNHSTSTIYRVSFELGRVSDGRPFMISSPVEMVTNHLVSCDGFQVRWDGKAAYTSNCVDGDMAEIDLTQAEEGTCQARQIMEGLINPTHIELATGIDGSQKLLVVCCGRIEVAWRRTASWREIINATETTIDVSVTTEG